MEHRHDHHRRQPGARSGAAITYERRAKAASPVLTELIRCRCDHAISAHAATGCSGRRCGCRLTAHEVLEAAIGLARNQWGPWNEPARRSGAPARSSSLG
jgi:hypothetical protein